MVNEKPRKLICKMDSMVDKNALAKFCEGSLTYNKPPYIRTLAGVIGRDYWVFGKTKIDQKDWNPYEVAEHCFMVLEALVGCEITRRGWYGNSVWGMVLRRLSERAMNSIDHSFDFKRAVCEAAISVKEK